MTETIADDNTLHPSFPILLKPRSREVSAAWLDIPDARVMTPSSDRLLYPNLRMERDSFCSRANLTRRASYGWRPRWDRSILREEEKKRSHLSHLRDMNIMMMMMNTMRIGRTT